MMCFFNAHCIVLALCLCFTGSFMHVCKKLVSLMDNLCYILPVNIVVDFIWIIQDL